MSQTSRCSTRSSVTLFPMPMPIGCLRDALREAGRSFGDVSCGLRRPSRFGRFLPALGGVNPTLTVFAMNGRCQDRCRSGCEVKRSDITDHDESIKAAKGVSPSPCTEWTGTFPFRYCASRSMRCSPACPHGLSQEYRRIALHGEVVPAIPGDRLVVAGVRLL